MECVWSSAADEPVMGFPVRPDGCLDILYSRERGLQVVGAMTVELRYDMKAGDATAGVRFHPGMAGPFLRTTPRELTDRVLPLQDLLGVRARHLQSRLEDAISVEDYARVLTAALPAPDAQPGPVQRAIRALADSRGAIDIDWAANQANLSSRQFRRRCLEESGITPKHLCRILRFRHAVERAHNARRADWAEIAVTCGYFDQAHLIRDFRKFTGRTPMAVFSNTSLMRGS